MRYTNYFFLLLTFDDGSSVGTFVGSIEIGDFVKVVKGSSVGLLAVVDSVSFVGAIVVTMVFSVGALVLSEALGVFESDAIVGEDDVFLVGDEVIVDTGLIVGEADTGDAVVGGDWGASVLSAPADSLLVVFTIGLNVGVLDTGDSVGDSIPGPSSPLLLLPLLRSL